MVGNRHLRRARRHARLGLPVPPEANHRLVKRVMLKLTWFTTAPQMDYNLAMVRAVSELTARVALIEDQLTVHRHHVSQVLAGIEASLRAELLGADRRGDQIETDLVRLSATVAALQNQLASLAAGTEAMTGAVADTEVAAVRSLPGQARR